MPKIILLLKTCVIRSKMCGFFDQLIINYDLKNRPGKRPAHKPHAACQASLHMWFVDLF